MDRRQIIRVEDVFKQRSDTIYRAYVAVCDEEIMNANRQQELVKTYREPYKLTNEIRQQNPSLGDPYPPQ